MKKLITKHEYTTSTYMTEDEILADITNLKARGASNICLEVGSSYWNDSELRWEFLIEETDEEYSERLAAEKIEAQRKEKEALKKQEAILKKREKDRKLYEKLKKEFGE